MSADFTPSLNTYTDLTPFRFWCQKILPIAYDDSLSYYELLCKVVDYLNKTMEDVELSIEDVEKLHDAYAELQTYVNTYFANLDVQEEINNKLDALVADGTIHDIFNDDVMAILTQAQAATQQAINNIPNVVGTWLGQHVTQETGYVIDDSLSTPNAAADALATGVADNNIKSAIDLALFGEIEDDDFVQGYRTQADYYTVHNQTIRCTSAKYYHVYKGDTVTISNIANGTKSAILGTYNNYDSSWKTSDFTYTSPAEQIVFVETAKSDDTADILVSDVTTVITLNDKSTRITGAENEISELKSDLDDVITKDTHRTYFGPIVQGHWVQKTGAEYATPYGLGIMVSGVSAGEVYYATGESVSSEYPLVVCFASDDSVVAYYKDDGNLTPVSDYKVIIPENCAKMWVNGHRQKEICVYKIDYANTTGDDIVAEIDGKQTKVVKWEKATYLFENGKFVNAATNSNIIAISSNSDYSYARLTYDKTKRYRFCGATRAATIFALVCTDENGVIIKKYEPYVDSQINIRLKEYNDIPEETCYIYVNGFGALTAYIEEAEERCVTSLKSGLVGVCFGDSITEGQNVYPTYIRPYLDYPSVVGNILGCTIYNGGLGGSCAHGSRKIDFASVVNAVVTGVYTDIYAGITEYGLNASANRQYDIIKTLDFSEVDFITLAYGTNDFTANHTKAQVTDALKNGIASLMTAYPNLRIYVFTPINRFNIGGSGEDADTYVNSVSGLKLSDIVDAVIDAANACHVPSKNMFYGCTITAQNKTLYMGDGTHPNANGYRLIGEKISAFINAN